MRVFRLKPGERWMPQRDSFPLNLFSRCLCRRRTLIDAMLCPSFAVWRSSRSPALNLAQ